MLQFDEKTGLLKNKSSKDCNSKKDEKITITKSRSEISIDKRIDKSLSIIAKRLNLNNETAREKRKYTKRANLSVKDNGSKGNSNKKSIDLIDSKQADQIGDMFGDAYYKSIKEISNALNPIKDPIKNFYKSSLSILGKLKNRKNTEVKSEETRVKRKYTKRNNTAPSEVSKNNKTAREKSIKDVEKDNRLTKILDENKSILKTDKKILKTIKNKKLGSTSSIFSVGILKFLGKILTALGALFSIKKIFDRFNPIKRKTKIREKNKDRNSNREKDRNKNKDKDRNRDKKERFKKKSTTRKVERKALEIGEKDTLRKVEKKSMLKIGAKATAKAGAKIGAKIGSKFVPILGEVLILGDLIGTAIDVFKGKGLASSLSENMLGFDATKIVKSDKSAISTHQSAINRRTHKNNSSKKNTNNSNNSIVYDGSEIVKSIEKIGIKIDTTNDLLRLNKNNMKTIDYSDTTRNENNIIVHNPKNRYKGDY
jgi:hypothetical protein